MAEQDTIIQQQDLLQAHRRTLAHLLQQAELHGGGALAPPHVVNGIDQARAEIRQLKAALRALGTEAADAPGDEPTLAGAISTKGSAYLARIHSRDAQLALRNRAAMLEKMRLTWIDGVLHQSLYHEAQLNLGLLTRPDAVALPLRAQVQELGSTPEPLPVGTSITDMYNRYQGALLILGAPGGGKTTLLLELANDLLDRALREPTHPIPVVFPLSTWAANPRPLDQWLRDELNQRYDVPRRLGQAWVEQEQILPLLDGLDEVAEGQRAACVAAINAFRQEHGLLPLVVSSRIEEYKQLTEGDARLRLNGAILLQALTRAEVQTYLQRMVPALDGVRMVLDAEPRHWLWKFALNPLMLSIVSLAYKDAPADELRQIGTLDQQRMRLFDAYTAAMFRRRGADHRYTQAQTVRWLMRLAQQLMQQNQTVFYLDGLQPTWLRTRGQRAQYWLGDRLLGILLGGLVGGLVGGLGSALGGGLASTLGRGLAVELVGGLVVGLVFGLGGGLIGGLLGRPRLGMRVVVSVEMTQWSWRRVVQSAANGLVVGLVVGLVFGLITGLIFPPGNTLLVGLLVGLVFGLV